jgi:hypothetical protein
MIGDMVQSIPSAKEKRRPRTARAVAGDDSRTFASGQAVASAGSEQKAATELAFLCQVFEGVLSPQEQEEITEIYLRIDRELAVEEARTDRLLRLYGL